ncbi:MAG: COX15/CtaA family protein [Myxococcota bacterium]
MTRVAPPSTLVRLWILLLYALVLSMVAVGGITRLTGSGLSMVVWQPLIGAIPPLNEAEWLATFDAYKQTPQFQQVNHWMALSDFQRIFLWEYLHRLLGRFIGLATGIPWLILVVRGHLRGRWAWLTLGAFVLGGMQGALGWFMVKSGLVDVPAVSHLRLAAHLTLAFLVGQFLLWIYLDASSPRSSPPTFSAVSWGALAVALGVVVQVIYGAFMAGTRAGYMYATFPDMNGTFVATGATELAPFWRNLLENPAMIHTVHRGLAWLLVIGVGVFAAWALRRPITHRTRVALWLMLSVAVAQLTLGALTVITHVNLTVAVLHQVTAFLLLSSCVLVVHRSRAPAGTLRG